jgi:tetratricopeptide (TPR) repeat protein
MNTVSLRKQASKLVLAVALATGTAMVAGHIVPDEAHAQRKKKGDEKQAEAQYSKEWREAFIPLDEQLKAEGSDPTAFSGEIEQLVGITKSGDEMLQTGQLIYNAGVRAGQMAEADAAKKAAIEMRLRGMDMMINSGKTPPEATGQYNFIAFQLASMAGQPVKARGFLQQAMDLGYSGDQSPSDLRVAMAQTYFSTNEYAKGLEVLDEAFASQQAAGQRPDERLYEIAFSVAYREDLQPQVFTYATERARLYPTDENWTNAINVVRVLNDYTDQETLDLLRLSRKAGVMNDKQEYIVYVETADARRLPQEVKDVIEEGYASGVVEREDAYLADQLRIASGRIESDRADLPAVESDARAADASLATVRAAGVAFLSYGEYDKAVEFYTKALGMEGVDTDETLTRLGIAQIGTEDYAGARETFAKITGKRAPIGNVWSAFARYQSDNGMAGAAPSDDGASPAEMTDAS